jgi:hypothetical protein
VLLKILQHNILASISIAINAKMTACVVHPDILTDHATANLSLAFILKVFPLFRDIRNTPE